MTSTRAPAPEIWDSSPGPALDRADAGGDSLLGTVNLFLRHRRWIAAGALAFFAIAVARKVTTPRTYSSVSRFLSDGGSSRASELSGLAAQFGIQLGADRSNFSPQFYIDLVQSPAILRPAVEYRYTFQTDSGPRTASLIDYYETHAETPARSRELAVRELASNLQTELSVKTMVVQLTVKTRNPELSAAVNRKLLDLLDEFNTNTRRSRATNERKFIDERMKVVLADLRRAEGNIENFLRSNRQYESSPSLRYDFDRLNTELNLARQVHTSYAQNLEQAKVDEIRDAPVLTVVQAPIPSVWPDGRGTIRAGVLAFLVGGIAGLVFGMARDLWRSRVGSGSEDAREAMRLIRDSMYDLRAMLTLGLWRRPGKSGVDVRTT